MPNAKLLIVEDEIDVAKVLSERLNVEGYMNVDISFTAQDAIALAQKAETDGLPYTLVLMDDKLGPDSKMDGIDATREIRRISKSTEVVIITGFGNRESGREARRAGAYRYIYKPTDIREIVTMIEYIPEWRRLEEQLKTPSEGRDWLQQIIGNARFGVSVIDRSWRILYMNQMQTEIQTDIRSPEEGGICWVEYNLGTDRKEPCPWCPVKESFEEGIPAKSITISPRRDGLHYYDVESVPLKDSQGRVIAALEAVRDVTERENLYSMTQQMQGTMELEERLRVILNAIHGMGYDRARVYLTSEDGEAFEGRMEVGQKPVGIEKIRLHFSEDGFSKEIKEIKEPKIFRKRWKYEPQFAEQLEKDVMDEWLDMPLVVDGRLIGKISVNNLISKRPLGQRDIEKLKPFAEHAAGAIFNAGEYSAIKSRAEELTALREVDATFIRELELKPSLNMITKACMELTGAISCYIRLREGNKLVMSAGVGVYSEVAPKVLDMDSKADNDSTSVNAVRTGQSVILTGAPEDSHLMRSKGKAVTKEQKEFFQRLRSWGTFPLRYGEDILGTLGIESDRDDFFTESMKSLIADFSYRAALAIRNAQLFDEVKQSLETRSKFMYALSHDLKTPLSRMQRQVDILRLPDNPSDLVLAEMKEKAFSIIRDELEWYNQMCQKLLWFSQIEEVGDVPIKKRPFDLGNLISQVIDIWEHRLRAKQITVHRIPKSLHTGLFVTADRALIREVISNLIENAVKYSLQGGEISVSVWEKSARVVVEVEDAGVGVAEYHRSRIFEPFFSVDAPEVRAKAGAGIGLAVCKEIMELHSGGIDFESQKGRGSKFWVWLPKGGLIDERKD